MKVKPELFVFVLALVSVIGAIVLLATGKAVPTELWALIGALVGGGLGITVPSALSAPAAAVALPAPPVAATAPAPTAVATLAPLAAVPAPTQ